MPKNIIIVTCAGTTRWIFTPIMPRRVIYGNNSMIMEIIPWFYAYCGFEASAFPGAIRSAVWASGIADFDVNSIERWRKCQIQIPKLEGGLYLLYYI